MENIRQVSTDWRLPNVKRNQIVKEANIRCHAISCTNLASRWSNLCSHCEYQYLNWNKPIFGLPSAEQMAEAKALVRDHFKRELETGLFDWWTARIASAMYRPEGKAIAPLKLKDMRSPTERRDYLLAWRAKGRTSKGEVKQKPTIGRTTIINLLAFALCIDTLITPWIVQPLRRDYLFHMLGMRLMGRKAVAQTKLRYRTKLKETGIISYTDQGPIRQTIRVEVEEPETTAYRIKRADFRLIGRMVWREMTKLFISGGREGQEWAGLRENLRLRLSSRKGASSEESAASNRG